MNTIAAILFSAHVKEISTRKWLWDVRLAEPGHTHSSTNLTSLISDSVAGSSSSGLLKEAQKLSLIVKKGG